MSALLLTKPPTNLKPMLNKLTTKFKMTIAAFLTGSTLVSAHPGHDLLREPLTHTLTSPYHLAGLALFGLSLLTGAAFVRRVAAKRALQLTGSLAIMLVAVALAAQFLG